MTDSVNMSLDEIIKQNEQNRPGHIRGRGGGNVRGRGGARGGRRGRGGGPGRRRSMSRGRVSNEQNRSRSRSRGPRGRSQSRGRYQGLRSASKAASMENVNAYENPRQRSQSRARSRSRSQRRNSYPRTRSGSRSRSRSRLRSITPKGRAGLENPIPNMPGLVRPNRGRGRGRGGMQMRLRQTNANQQGTSGIHSRLGITTRQSGASNNYKPLAVAKRGISKRGFGLITRNRYSNIGLRSDQILKEQRQNSVIRSQTFTRSRHNSFGSAAQLTVSVANDMTKRRRNSVGNAYLNKQALASFEFGGYNTRRGPGSVKSTGSNRSNRSNQSNSSRISNQSRGRGRGRGGNRGIGRKFVNKQVLNRKLQKEIAAIQGRSYGANNSDAAPSGINNFAPTPAATKQTLHQRFAAA